MVMVSMRTLVLVVLVAGTVGVVGGGVLRWLGIETEAEENKTVDNDSDYGDNGYVDDDVPDGPFTMVTEDNIEEYESDSDEDNESGSYSDEEL